MTLSKRNNLLIFFFIIWTFLISTTTVVAINGLTIADGPGDVHALIESTGHGYARLWFGQHGTWKGSVGLNSSGALTLGLGNSDNDNVTVKSNSIEFNPINSNGSALRLFDESKNLLGGIFSQRGASEVVGILDGDNNYSYIARKDNRTDLRINNSNIFTAWSDGRVGARQYCDENGNNCTLPGASEYKVVSFSGSTGDGAGTAHIERVDCGEGYLAYSLRLVSNVEGAAIPILSSNITWGNARYMAATSSRGGNYVRGGGLSSDDVVDLDFASFKIQNYSVDSMIRPVSIPHTRKIWVYCYDSDDNGGECSMNGQLLCMKL